MYHKLVVDDAGKPKLLKFLSKSEISDIKKRNRIYEARQYRQRFNMLKELISSEYTKAKRKEYYEKNKERYREYYRRPEIVARRKKWAKKYFGNPKVKKRIKEYAKEYSIDYNRRPEVIEHRKKYNKEYYSQKSKRNI